THSSQLLQTPLLEFPQTALTLRLRGIGSSNSRLLPSWSSRLGSSGPEALGPPLPRLGRALKGLKLSAERGGEGVDGLDWSLGADQLHDDQSNPSTPSPPLSADSFKPFKALPSLGNGGPSASGPEDPSLEDQDGSSLLFDEPIPRKRKNSMKVMFKCLWKNCGKVLSTAAGIQRHIRTVHLGEDFYYTEIKLNADPAVAEGLTPASPAVLSPPSHPPSSSSPPLTTPTTTHHHHHPTPPPGPPAGATPTSRPPSTITTTRSPSPKDNHGGACNGRLVGGGGGGGTPLRSFGTQRTLPHPHGPRLSGISSKEAKASASSDSQPIAVLSSPPRPEGSRRGEEVPEGVRDGKPGTCGAPPGRWKKACQRFTD
ncbi:LOW QUALITY PROTEIN: hypothetical protein CRUP_023955, partial [Coryphaenoides rupestris]